MLVFGIHAPVLPVEILGQLLVDVLLDEDNQVLPGDLQVDNRLAYHHAGCQNVVKIEVGHLALGIGNLSKWIWHGQKLVVDAYKELLLAFVGLAIVKTAVARKQDDVDAKV